MIGIRGRSGSFAGNGREAPTDWKTAAFPISLDGGAGKNGVSMVATVWKTAAFPISLGGKVGQNGVRMVSTVWKNVVFPISLDGKCRSDWLD